MDILLVCWSYHFNIVLRNLLKRGVSPSNDPLVHDNDNLHPTRISGVTVYRFDSNNIHMTDGIQHLQKSTAVLVYRSLRV